MSEIAEGELKEGDAGTERTVGKRLCTSSRPHWTSSDRRRSRGAASAAGDRRWRATTPRETDLSIEMRLPYFARLHVERRVGFDYAMSCGSCGARGAASRAARVAGLSQPPVPPLTDLEANNLMMGIFSNFFRCCCCCCCCCCSPANSNGIAFHIPHSSHLFLLPQSPHQTGFSSGRSAAPSQPPLALPQCPRCSLSPRCSSSAPSPCFRNLSRLLCCPVAKLPMSLILNTAARFQAHGPRAILPRPT